LLSRGRYRHHQRNSERGEGHAHFHGPVAFFAEERFLFLQIQSRTAQDFAPSISAAALSYGSMVEPSFSFNAIGMDLSSEALL
jgi:hypothetical protein